MEHLKESADITLPALSHAPDDAQSVEAALAQAQLPFVGSSPEALALTADRARQAPECHNIFYEKSDICQEKSNGGSH